MAEPLPLLIRLQHQRAASDVYKRQPKMDPTFIASLLSGTLAGYGITRAGKDREEDSTSTVITAKPPARKP